LAAAVCHATNWDRLRGALANLAGSDIFTPRVLSELTLEQFDESLGSAFADNTDLAARHQLFTTVAAAFASPSSAVSDHALRGRPQRLAGSSGFYEVLDGLPAFRSDPQRKKTRILVQQLYRYRLVEFVDPENLRPATEYHLIRLYLRTERVEHVEGLEIGTDTSRASDIRSVTALRVAVEEAMHYTAAGAAMPIADLNEIEWQIARSYCERKHPRCFGPPRADKPVDEAILNASSGACPFASTCRGPERADIAGLSEPRLAAHHAFY
jgi:hypothetical protein